MSKQDPVSSIANGVTDTIKTGLDVVTDLIGTAIGYPESKPETKVEIETSDGRRYEGTVKRKK